MRLVSYIISIFYCWLICISSLSAQTPKADSLLKIFSYSKTDQAKLQTVLDLCEEHNSLNRDSLYDYALFASALADKVGSKNDKGLAAVAMANAYLRWGWTDSSIAAVASGLKHCSLQDTATHEAYFKLNRAKALSYGGKSNFKEALSILYQIVNEAEKHRDSLVAISNLNTIGSVAIARDQYREAISWLTRAMTFSTPDNRSHAARAATYVNMANAYYLLNTYDSAQLYIQRSISLARQVQNLNTLATALRIQSNIAIGTNKLKEAESSLLEMIELRKITGDGPGIADDNLLMVDFYLRTGQPEKGVSVCKNALVRGNIYGDEGKTYTNNINIRLLYYEALGRCYKALGNHSSYEETLEQLIAAKDSFYQVNSAEAIAELRTKYEVQKMENTMIQQQLDLTRKNYLIYGAFLLSISLIIIGWLIFRNYRRKQKIKLTLMREEEKRFAEEAVKLAEEAERKRIAADLHDNLGAYAASIDSNIDQISLSRNDRTHGLALQELRNNSKAIVSQLSDTIWVLKKDSLSLTAISDRLKVFIQKLSSSYPGIQIDVLEKIEVDHLLPPSQAFHLFKVLQEAINNSLRHSGCTQVNVIMSGEDSWKVMVMDDGKGFDTTQLSQAGNGLGNMLARSKECGWVINWTENTPSGTSVIIAPTTN